MTDPKKNFDPENMSRDELIACVKQQFEGILYLQNFAPVSRCPFCIGYGGMVPTLRLQVKAYLIEEWNKPVTEEEYSAYFEKRNAK